MQKNREEQQTKLVEGFEAKLQALEKANEDLQKDLSEKQTLLTTLQDRIQQIEDPVLSQIKEKSGANEQTMTELMEQIDEFRKDMVEKEKKFVDTLQKAHTAERKAEEFGDSLKEFESNWKSMTKAATASDAKVEAFQEDLANFRQAQDDVHETVSKLREGLFKEVKEALGSFNMQSIQELQKDISKKNDQTKTETKNLVSYALEIMAKVSAERKQTNQRQDLVLAWRNHSWISQRRKLGYITLCRLFNRRREHTLQRWRHRTDLLSVCAQVADEYKERIPDVHQELDQCGIFSRLQEVEVAAQKLGNSAVQETDITGRVDALREEFDSKLERISEFENELANQSASLSRIRDDTQKSHGLVEKVCEERHQTNEKISRIEVVLRKEVAHTNEVQGMMKDVLLIWNSIKQLDTAKADKKEIDAMALENANRDKLQQRYVDEMKDRMAGQTNDEVNSLTKNFDFLAHRVDENAQQFQTVQQMLGSLAQFVEELVTKIAENQGMDASRFSVLRTGGGYRGHQERREDVVVEPPPPENDQEGMDRWLRYAKGIVDSTIESAVGDRKVLGARPPRPRSAGAPPRPSSAEEDREEAHAGVCGMRIPGISDMPRGGGWRTGFQAPVRKGSSFGRPKPRRLL